MNKFLFLIFLILCVSCTSLPSKKQRTHLPRLFFEYSFLYEGKCKRSKDYADIKKLGLKKLSSFKTSWLKNMEEYFNPIFNKLNKGFKRSELSGTITFCGHGSISTPLIIDLYREIKYDENRPDFSSNILVFHELLHTYVVDNVNFPTPLSKKYAQENRVTRNHLHLMALQLYAFKELKLQSHIDYLDRWHHNMGPAYKRAWEIVTEVEGDEAFLAELK